MSEAMAETPQVPGGENLPNENESVFKKPVHKTAKRNLLIIGGVLLAGVGIIAVMFILAVKKTPDQAVANIGTINPRSSGQGKGLDANTMSPAMAENIKKAQSIEADAAKKAGTTYVDVEAPMGHGEKVTPAETAPMKDIGNTSRNNNVNQQAAGTSYPIAPPMNSEGLKKQVELMAQNLEPVTTETLEIKLVKDDGAAGAAKSNGAMQNANGAAKFLGPVLASGLDIFGGYLSSPIDTDKTTFASATITGGKLDGAYLTGDTKRSESDVGLHFTAMQFNKKMYEIDAIALNEKTASDAMDGTVDRHVLTKYVFPIVLAAAGGFSQARAQTGSQVQSLGLGQNVLSVPAPTTEQATNAGIAKGLDVAAQANQQLASRPNQVTLNSKTPVGILFRKPVYEQ